MQLFFLSSTFIKIYLIIRINFLTLINFFFFDLFAFVLKNINFNELYFLQSFDIVFANFFNIKILVIVLLVNLGFIFFLLLQANLLNLSFYPNSTFDAEKYSPYECGFAPFWTERAQFDIKFYLVALLFLVFDVELMFLLPYCISYFYLGFYGYIIFLLFFSILIIGFLVEWSIGMLVWKGENEATLWKKQLLINKNTEINKKHLYAQFLTEYLSLVEMKVIKKKNNLWHFHASTFAIRWISFWRPYNERFYNQEQNYWWDKESNPNKWPVFYGIEDVFFGSATFSFYELYLFKEKQAIQPRIERFFLKIYGEPYWIWLESLSPEERNFAF